MQTTERSILREIENSKGYEVALLTTYNFEVSFFEKYIYSLLAQNQIRMINVFVDSKELTYAIKDSSSDILGRKYFVTPIPINGAFHPKVILLLGKDKAKMIVSSANIKLSGYIYNNEVFSTFEYSKDDTEYANMFVSVLDFFKKIYDLGSNKDEDIRKKLDEFTIEGEGDPSYSLLFNTDKSILGQALSLIEDKIIGVNIAVPFYDKTLEGLRQIEKETKCDNVRLFIQNNNNTFPIEYNKVQSIVSSEKISIFETVKANDTKSFYHGKVIEFLTEKNSYVLYGSANCTSSALLRTYHQNGNVECDVLVKGEPGSNQEYFQIFEINSELPLQNGFANVMEEYSPVISCIYGETVSNNVKLYISTSIKGSPIITLNDEELEYSVVNGCLEVSIPLMQLISEGCLFEIEIKYGNQIQKVKCWFNDKFELIRNRYDFRSAGLEDFDRNSGFGQYEEYVRLLFDALYNNENWYKIAKGINLTKKMQNPDDMDEAEVEEGFIIYSDSINAIREKEISTSIYKNASAFARRYFDSIVKNKSKPKQRDQLPEVPLEYPDSARKPREATPAEKRLERIFKRHFNRYLTVLESDEISYDECKTQAGVILDVIKMVKENEKITDCFDLDYIIELKTKISRALIRKARVQEDFDDKDELIYFALLTIVEREYYHVATREDNRSEDMIYDLNKMFRLRESFGDYVRELKLDSIEKEIKGKNSDIANDLIDKLFGYKTFDQLQAYFKDLYGFHTRIQVKDMFRMDTSIPREKFPLNGLGNKIIEEITRYIRGYQLPISKIELIFDVVDSKDWLQFDMRTDGRIAYKMERTSNLSGHKLKYKCRNESGVWRIDMKSRQKIN